MAERSISIKGTDKDIPTEYIPDAETPPTPSLLDQIKVVAEARDKALKAEDIKRVAVDKWAEENEELIQSVVDAKRDVNDSEAILRELTLQAYAETGNKAPAPGVGIREVTKLDYDNKVAFDWAVKHTMALKLDSRAFEKIVKASPLGFVTVTQEPQATIATDLSEFL